MGEKFTKFPPSELTREREQEFASKYDVNVFSVSSAVAIAAPIAKCSRDRLLDAVRVGSLHAIDLADEFYCGTHHRGGATRLAFHVDSITAWANDHAAITTAHRQANAARLNRDKNLSSGDELGDPLVMWVVDGKKETGK